MKKLHLALFFSLVALAASSQKVYFFYIQTESEQPFYVKMDKKVQYSSPGGYIILPRLYDSSYKLSIGFPQNKWPEQNFALNVNKKDHGFVLRNVPEKGWGLYDLQSLEFMMALSGEEKKQENGNVTAFTDILSKAADDPSLKEKTAQVKPEEKKPEPVVVEEPVKTEPTPTQVVAVTDNTEKTSKKGKRKSKEETKEVVAAEPAPQQVAVNTEEDKSAKKTRKDKEVEKEKEIRSEQTTIVPVDTVAKSEPLVVKEEVKPVVVKEEVKPVVVKEEPKTEVKEEIKAPVKEEVKTPAKEEVKTEQPAKESELDNYKKSQVKRYAESSTTEGFGLVFVDQYENGNKDTIRLVIPNPKPVIDKVPEVPKEEKKFLEISSAPAEKTVAEKPKEEKKEEAVVSAPVEKKKKEKTVEEPVAKKDYANGCTAAASDNDLSKLNRKMKTVNDDEEKMIAEARKYFKTTCFTTAQVKELSTLFINDEARYNFFDLAYKYVIDPDNFSSLQSEIKDLYYQSRFKAMLRN